MSHLIKYEGDSSFAMDAVLAAMTKPHDQDAFWVDEWFVELKMSDAQDVETRLQGIVLELVRAEGESVRVLIAEADDEGERLADKTPVWIDTDTIFELVVP